MKIKKLNENNKYLPDANFSTDDFWYDVFDGGYIKPEEIMTDPIEAKKLNDAIDLLRKWKDDLEEDEIFEYR